MTATRKGPFRLVTVNTAPERAKLLVGRMIDGMKDQYDIEYMANCSTMEEVAPKVKQYQPNILFSASMWTPEQAKKIKEIAERERPGIVTHAIPEGLQVERGPDAIVEYLLQRVPILLDSMEL